MCLKHSKKKPEEIVQFVADGMLEPHFVKWYHTNQKQINTMNLDAYLTKFAKYALPCKWEHRVLNTLLSAKQGNKLFSGWEIKLKNLNALLSNTKSTCCLSSTALQAQLEVNMNPDLCAKLDNMNLIASTFSDWIHKVTELDKDLCEENACTQYLINTNNTAQAMEQERHKLLAEHLSDQPTHTQTLSSTSSNINASTLCPPQLTKEEKKIFKKHKGCTRC
ncbi:hypothetical protein C0989_008205 [Termitomyces sp. Mn162]|nr:hypothetical protein C0989_008205 [Termitomyces sp. Mn162]